MPIFDEKKQTEKLNAIRGAEEEDLAKMLSAKYGIPYLDMFGIPISTNALKLVPEETARDANVAVFSASGKKIDAAVLAPEDIKTKTVIQELEQKGYKANLFLVSRNSLEKAFERYKDVMFFSESKSGLLEISNEDIAKFLSEIKTIDEIKSLIKKTLGLQKSRRVTIIIETILACGLSLRASDIHIEPGGKNVKIRIRMDGVLVPIADFDFETYELLLSRIKLVAGMKISKRESAQDGRFTIRIKEIDIEIRVSTLPSEYGESIVLRILNPDTISIPINELGIEPELLKIIENELQKPNGMILNTGPTGSGKTTTLYAFLKKIYSYKSKIITIEDPIEYHISGITQTQVNPEKDYTFAEGLKSILRQDPDVIMVGEIRDRETAEIAVNASLTGHLVFSTLHTNNASGTFPRLAEFGVDPKLMGSAISVAMAQRLIRKLCVFCKEKIQVVGEDKKIIDGVIKEIEEKGLGSIIKNRDYVWTAKGCEKCNGMKYSGRIGIFEAVVVDENIEKIVRENPSERDIAKSASKQKILDMRQDGILKVLNGTTDMEELKRVVDLTNE